MSPQCQKPQGRESGAEYRAWDFLTFAVFFPVIHSCKPRDHRWLLPGGEVHELVASEFTFLLPLPPPPSPTSSSPTLDQGYSLRGVSWLWTPSLRSRDTWHPERCCKCTTGTCIHWVPPKHGSQAGRWTYRAHPECSHSSGAQS